jgi:aryl-alcohol dehydrogenase-like predicted oxidoreductase
MKTVQLGHAGVEVSAMCLGTMYFGTKADEETSQRLLDAYVEAGGAFLDTANVYAHWAEGGMGGESEQLLGRWMRDRKNRDGLFIASKVGFSYPGNEDGLRAGQIVEECDKSLERLGIDTIDLYYAHHDDRRTPLEESLEAFDRLIREGKVRHIGASNYVAWRLAEALQVSRRHDWAEFCCAQQKHTYLRPKRGIDFRLWPPANEEFLELCETKGLAVVAYSPLLRGAYSRDDRPFPKPYRSADSDARLAVLRAVAADRGVTPGQITLAWMLHARPTTIPLFSASRPEQLSENLAALDVDLSDDEMARLNQAREK